MSAAKNSTTKLKAWRRAVRKELAIVIAKAGRPRPQGISQEIWDAIVAPYKMEIPFLRAILRDLE